MSDRDWRALQQALVDTVQRLSVPQKGEGEEERRGSSPTGAASDVRARADAGPRTPGVEAAAGGLAATAEPDADVGRQDTPPATIKSTSYSENPTLQALRNVVRSAAASLPVRGRRRGN